MSSLSKRTFYVKFIKRVIDLILSILILILLIPLLTVISIIIKLESKGPIFFTQDRVGEHNRVFRIYKFRTMINNAENIGTGLKISGNDPRITRVGKFLRTTSIDELPQIINILKGDMSIIGPRPTIKKVVEQLSEDGKKRHVVKPGITGLAQVNGRQSLNWSEKIKYDVQYVDSLSFKLDIKILFLTILVVLKRDGVHKKEISNQYKNL
ncbi:sugar transferase [Bacillus piscicola]|uniref:sugar transferase n=1 Tax=Bacillus piscicola TaxID=1632684 RepID=UPI001F0965A1